MSSRRLSSRTTSYSQYSNGKTRIKAKRRYLLKVTPIEAWDLLPAESGRGRNSYCTLVLLDENKREIKGEKQRTPPMRHSNPVWSPLKAAVLRSLESNVESHQPLGIGAAAASEEYTFGIQTNLVNAKYVLVKCKDKGRVENEDLGRLLLSLEDMNTSGEERVAWYDLQLRPGGKMKRVQGKVRISSRIVREPSLWQLWTCAEQMRQEIPSKDRSLYLKPHPNVITGKEALEWMLCHGLNRPMQGGVTCSTAEEALLLGTALIRNGMMMHVSGDRRFTNSTWKYYRFMVNHLDSAVQKEAIRQRDMIISGEAEEVEDMEEEVLTRSMMAMSVSNEEEIGLGASQVRGGVAGGSSATTSAAAAESDRGKSKSTIKIEDFELLKVLGTGTYGRVLSARGPDGNVYAIKIITKIGMDDNMRRNAKIERDMLREVRHPFVASLLFAFQNEDKVYMGMEFYNGGDLRHHLTMNQNDELKLTPGRIKFYAAELVTGLAHLHSLDIIYRDLKPENILVQKDGHIVLVDFGLSTYARGAGDKKAHSLAGSPEYISPEVLAAANPKKGEAPAIYDMTCDWWSLGILIFEMYIGRTPFKDENKAIMYRNIAEGFLYIPPELPEDVQSLLAGLIERDPSKRLGANEAVPFSIMKHPFFEGIDWEALQQKKVQPEWVPDVIDDADAKYVDNEFINQVPVDTPEWRMLDSVDREREYFEDFTYRATKVIQKHRTSSTAMFGSSENDAQERLLRAPLNPQQAAISNTGNPSGIRQQEIRNAGGLTSLSTPSTYWQKIKMMEAATLMRYLRYTNVLLAVLQALAGFLGLFNLVVLDITCFLISVYAIIFALLLLAFECRFKHMEPWIRQQFGFLFTYRGRTAFIFIVGFMDFGMEGSLPDFVGLLMCGNAILSLFIMLFHPQFREGTLDMNMDPTVTYRPAVEETETLLRQHEGMASKAGAFVLHEAEQHPEFMAKMAQSYASQHGYVPPAQK